MPGQTRYFIYRISLIGGAVLTGCSPDEDLWERATDSHVMGKRTWLKLTKWDGNDPWHREADSGRFIEVNMDHVAGVEKWQELR